jgi:hypothetical protein
MIILFTVKGFLMDLYYVTCKYGYSILGEAPHKLDTSCRYIVVDKSKYIDNCFIIQREDKLAYKGDTIWIVPEHALIQLPY